MQFIPSSWAMFAVDGDGDGKADPFDIDDGRRGGAKYLCRAGGGDLRTEAGQRNAVYSYNRSDEYVDWSWRWPRSTRGGRRSTTLPARNGTPRPLPPIAKPTLPPGTVGRSAGRADHDPAGVARPAEADHGHADRRRRTRPARLRRRTPSSPPPTTPAEHAGTPTPSDSPSPSPTCTPAPSASPSPSSSGTNTPNGIASAAGTPAGAAATGTATSTGSADATGTPTPSPTLPPCPS